MLLFLNLFLSLAFAEELTRQRADALLVQPIPRDKTSNYMLGHPPCGERPKGPAHYIADPGSLNPIAWSVRQPSPNANCTVKLSHGTDFAGYEVLEPIDKSSDESGWFPCLRHKSDVEGKVVSFPKNLTCDSCTIQLTIQTEEGMHYQCSDVAIVDNTSTGCYGKCKNGGVCFQGECICLEGFVGTYCEKLATDGDGNVNYLGYFVLFVILVLILTGLSTCVYLFYNKREVLPDFIVKRFQPESVAAGQSEPVNIAVDGNFSAAKGNTNTILEREVISPHGVVAKAQREEESKGHAEENRRRHKKKKKSVSSSSSRD
jgi:hypothetical protein